jgi:hypothetical protein
MNMKLDINTCDRTFWASIWCTLIVSLVALFIVLSAHYTERVKAAFSSGYVETQNMTGGYWVKPSKP